MGFQMGAKLAILVSQEVPRGHVGAMLANFWVFGASWARMEHVLASLERKRKSKGEGTGTFGRFSDPFWEGLGTAWEPKWREERRNEKRRRRRREVKQ